MDGGGGEEECGIRGDAFGVEDAEVFGAWVHNGMGQRYCTVDSTTELNRMN